MPGSLVRFQGSLLQVLSTARGLMVSALLKAKGTVFFSIRTDQDREIIYLSLLFVESRRFVGDFCIWIVKFTFTVYTLY